LLFIGVVVACAVMKLTSSIILPIVVSMLL
jgi:hypothetical protein